MAVVNPWGVTTGSSYAGAPPRAPQPGSYFGSNAGVMLGPTFSSMQRQGQARPPAPTPYPAPAPAPYPAPAPAPAAPPVSYQPRPITPPPVTVPPAGANPPTAVPGGTPLTEGAGNMGSPNILATLMQNYFHPTQSPVTGGIQQQLMSLLQKPSAYDSDQAKATFERLRQGLDEGYGVDQQKLREEMARRGLGDSTVYGGRLGDLSVQHGRDLSNLAGQITEDQAKTSATDRSNAIATALGFTNSQNANTQQSLQNLLGYGQQSFQNQLATQNANNSQQQQAINMLLQLFGVA